MNLYNLRFKTTTVLAMALFAVTAHTTPKTEITRHSIGHSTVRSTGGGIELSATIGQTGAGVLTGGGIELTVGFWFELSPFDCDEDGVVGYLDHRRLTTCFTGPDTETLSDCQCFDSDASGTIDLKDAAAFQLAFNSAEPVPGKPDITTVVGEVQIDGVPFAGALVELMGYERTTLSGTDGRFQFENVPTTPVLINVVATANAGGQDVFGGVRFHKSFRGGVTDVGIITLSDIVRWVQPIDGLWSTDSNWEAFFPPGQDQSVVIDLPESDPTVTFDDSVIFNGPIGDLLCNERLRIGFFNSLSVAGSFQMNNTLEMEFGELVDSTVDLGPSGLINILRGSEMDGVTVNGNMDLVTNYPNLTVQNGLTLNGDVRLTGLNSTTGSSIRFEGPNKFIDGNATISFISTGNKGGASIFQNTGGNLHIRSGVTIRGTGGFIGQSGAPLVHDGLIHSDLSGIIQVRGLDWTNNGTLRVSGSGSRLATIGSWINNGSVEAVGAGTLILGDSWQNLGTLTATDAVVRLHHDFTIADLGTFDFVNSQVIIEGTFTNDTDLVLDANQFHWSLGGGTVLGGTISSADGTTFDITRNLVSRFHILDGVTLNADMRYLDRPGPVQVRNGLILNGTISMLNANDALIVDEPNRMIDGTGRIEFLRHYPDFNIIGQADSRGADDLGVMTIGPGITIAGANGRVGYNNTNFGAPVSLINKGTIQAINHLGTLTLYGDDWINDGLLESFANSGQMDAVGSWTNNGTVHVQGGFTAFDTWTNNGTVHVDGGNFSAKDTWTNNGTLRIGSGPFIESLTDFTQSSTGTYVSEVRSMTEDGHGLMLVAGTVTLDGVVRLEFEPGFTPEAGQSFTVMLFGSHVGEFASIEAPGLDPSLEVVAVYSELSLSLRIQFPE